MIQWILEHLGVVVIIVLFLAQIIRGALQSRKETGPPQMRREAGTDDRRVREVQEQIRRQIEARRRGQDPADAPASTTPELEARPMSRAETTQMPEPFGGPLGRMLEELQRKAQQHLPPPAPPILVEKHHTGELERQQRLADQLKAVEETRHVTERRAAHVAADKLAVAQSESALRTDARQRLLRDLGDPQSLRRAFVLREVLGTPVGLR
jgi:hypothetical protein